MVLCVPYFVMTCVVPPLWPTCAGGRWARGRVQGQTTSVKTTARVYTSSGPNAASAHWGGTDNTVNTQHPPTSQVRSQLGAINNGNHSIEELRVNLLDVESVIVGDNKTGTGLTALRRITQGFILGSLYYRCLVIDRSCLISHYHQMDLWIYKLHSYMYSWRL